LSNVNCLWLTKSLISSISVFLVDLEEINDFVIHKQLTLDKSLIHLRAELKQIKNEGQESLLNNKAMLEEKELLVNELEDTQSKTNYLYKAFDKLKLKLDHD
jgi:hypothetical protein